MKLQLKFLSLTCGVFTLFAQAPTHPVLPNSPNVLGSNWSLSLQGNFLYWIASEQGLDFAQIYRSEASAIEVSAPNHFDPGYKVSIGIYPNFDGADLTLRYSWFQQPARTSSFKVDPDVTCVDNPDHKICNITSQDVGKILAQLYDISGSIKSAKASWSYHLNEGEIELGKRYKLSRFFRMRPYMGLKALWQEQSFYQYYSIDLFDLDELLTSFISHSNQTSFGIGPRIGFDIKYRFYKKFGIFANASYSVLSTRFSNTMKQYLDFLLEFDDVINDIRKKVSTTQPLFEILLGLDFDHYLADDQVHIGLFFGWEFKYFNHNNFFQTNAERIRSGDLSIQGVNFKLQLDF